MEIIMMDDSMIVDLYFNRDDSAITEVQNKYGSVLRGIIFRIVDNIDITDECENDTYMESWERIPPHEPRNFLLPFLAKIARHISIDRMRSENCQKRQAVIIDISDEIEQIIPSNVNVEKLVEDKIIVACLNDGIKKLSEYKRIIFIRRYFYLDTIEELSRKTGYTQSKIKSILSRCRKELSKYLKEKCGYDF